MYLLSVTVSANGNSPRWWPPSPTIRGNSNDLSMSQLSWSCWSKIDQQHVSHCKISRSKKGDLTWHPQCNPCSGTYGSGNPSKLGCTMVKAPARLAPKNGDPMDLCQARPLQGFPRRSYSEKAMCTTNDSGTSTTPLEHLWSPKNSPIAPGSSWIPHGSW